MIHKTQHNTGRMNEPDQTLVIGQKSGLACVKDGGGGVVVHAQMVAESYPKR